VKKVLIIIFTFFLPFWGYGQYAVSGYQKFHHSGRELAQQGNYQAAIDSFTLAINIMPYYSTIYFDRGMARLQTGHFKGAVRDFNEVIRKHPYKQYAVLGRGVAYFHLEEFELAKNDFIQVLYLSPDNWEAEDYLTQIHDIQNQVRYQELKESQRTEYDQIYREREEAWKKQERNYILWGTVVPLAVWTAAWLIWG